MKKKRIVVKIGSSSLTNDRGEIDQEKFTDHVNALAELRKAGHEVLLVSSGAVAAGFGRLGYQYKTNYAKRKTGSGGCWAKLIDTIVYR